MRPCLYFGRRPRRRPRLDLLAAGFSWFWWKLDVIRFRVVCLIGLLEGIDYIQKVEVLEERDFELIKVFLIVSRIDGHDSK